MTSKEARPKSITEYINAAPKETKKKLHEMRACIRAAAPGGQGKSEVGVSAFSYREDTVTFAAFKHHIGFYPTPSAVRAFANDLSKFVTADASIQFPLEKPLPRPLIRKITAFRVRKSIEEDRKKKEHQDFAAPEQIPIRRFASRRGSPYPATFDSATAHAQSADEAKNIR
jgi:uncharacterized protein YdhG (YjbR/CyaY superfamily)